MVSAAYTGTNNGAGQLLHKGESTMAKQEAVKQQEAVELVTVPANNVIDFSGFTFPVTVVTATPTAESVGFLYSEAIRLRTSGIAAVESKGLANAILAGDSFNLYVQAEALTARGAAEAVERYTTAKATTIRAYGRIADLAVKVGSSVLLTVGTTNNAQKLGFLSSPSITAEAAKAAVIAFVAGEKLNTIKQNLHITVKDSDLPDGEFLNKWLSVHYYGEEEENKEQAEEFKKIKRILSSIVKANVKEIVLSALLADKAREEDNTEEDNEGFQGTIPEEPEVELPKRPIALVEVPKVVEPIATSA